jgi:hypothetical protein
LLLVIAGTRDFFPSARADQYAFSLGVFMFSNGYTVLADIFLWSAAPVGPTNSLRGSEAPATFINKPTSHALVS